MTNNYEAWLSPADQERRGLRREARFIGIGMLLLSVFSMFMLTVVLLVLRSCGVAFDLNDDYLGLGNTYYLLMYMVAYILMMGAPMWISALFIRGHKRPFAAHKRVSFTTALCVVLMGMGGCVLANLAAGMWSQLLEDAGITQPAGAQMMDATPLSLILNLVTIAVLPAILEEMAFRGFVLQSLRKLGDPAAIVLSAILFGAMHENLWQIPFATIVGLILGWIVVKTENIWLAVIIHFGNNAMATVAQYMGLQSDEASSVAIIVMFASIVTLAIAAAAILLWKRDPVLVPPRAVRTNLTPKERRRAFLFSPWIILTWVAFGLMTVLRLF